MFAICALALLPGLTRLHDVEALASRLDSIIEPALGKPAPGVAVTVIHGGEVVWFRGYGVADRKEGGEITEDTAFAIASISKSVSAWGFLRLVEQGEVGLDDPVVERLEGWAPRKMRGHAHGITLRRLLSHTAGLNVHGVESVRHGKRLPSLRDAILGKPRGFRRVDLVQGPGQEYRYSGGGTSIAQLLFEELTGRDFATAMHEDVVRPLGMSTSGFQWTAERIAVSATPYLPSGKRTSYWDYPQAAPAAFVTTSRDFAKFAIACLPDHRPPEAEAILSRESLVAMLARSEEASNAGLGFLHKPIAGLDTVGHTGGDYGWTSTLRLVPESGDALIIFQNSFESIDLYLQIEGAWARWLR